MSVKVLQPWNVVPAKAAFELAASLMGRKPLKTVAQEICRNAVETAAFKSQQRSNCCFVNHAFARSEVVTAVVLTYRQAVSIEGIRPQQQCCFR